MKNNYVPNFSPFNKRDMSALTSILAPVVFILFISCVMHTFVLNAIRANLYINLGIISATVFGIYLILNRLLGAQKDFRIIERFGFEAKKGVYMKVLLEEPWLKNRYVSHYLTHIANTGGTLATQLEQNAIEGELHALQSDYESKLELPQFIAGFMIAMGLLGTFIGLLETLTGISGMLDGMGNSGADVQSQFMKLVVELRKPLAGMGIAFSASMFGLITSLTLSIMMTNLRRYVSRVISLARNVMYELTEVVHGNVAAGGGVSLSQADIDAFLTGSRTQNMPVTQQLPALPVDEEDNKAEQQKAPPRNIDYHERYPNARFGGGIDPAMSGRFDILTKKIEILLDVFEENTDSVRKLSDLIGYGPRMKELSEKTLEEMRGLSTISNDQHRLTEALLLGNSELVRLLSSFVESQKLANSEGFDHLRKLSDLVIDMKDVGISSGRHLNELKENFAKLGISKNMEIVEMVASSLSGQTALLESLVQENRRSQQTFMTMNQSLLSIKARS